MSFSATFVMMFFSFFLLFYLHCFMLKKNNEQNLGVRKK